MIRAFKDVIGNGFVGKTELISAARDLTNFSKAKLDKTYTRYVGSDPAKHIWDFKVGDRGTHNYFLHPNSTALDPKPVVQDDLLRVNQADIKEDVSDE